MKNLNLITKSALILVSMWFLSISVAQAGDANELKSEISFLAKKLLDMSGEDSITVEQEAYMKPFIGICSEVEPDGVRLTCITPGHNAQAAGLKTGDLVTSINDISMRGMKPHDYHSRYYKIVGEMKSGDKLLMNLVRHGKKKNITVTVGEIRHPAYTLTVTRK